MSSSTQIPDEDKIDDDVVEKIVEAITATPPRSFSLIAGAGAGKTHTLKEALARLTGRMPEHKVGRRYAERLRLRGQRIAVITYTRVAAEEVERRLEHNPLVEVSTIHTFCWRLIQGFDTNIRARVKHDLEFKLTKLESVPPKENNRAKKPLEERMKEWEAERARLNKSIERLPQVATFTYSPDVLRFGEGALTHAQVIDFTAKFIEEQPGMRRLIAARFPIILIDESQDTFKRVLAPLLGLESAPLYQVRLGLVGDHRQRVYMDGYQSLLKVIPESWDRLKLRLNHRSSKRVVRLINDIWTSPIDGRTEIGKDETQQALSTSKEGLVHLFLGDTTHPDKNTAEVWAAQRMAALTKDATWTEPRGYKMLLLEHRLAAQRGGFEDFFVALVKINKDGAVNGNAPELAVFQTVFEPLYRAWGDDGTIDGWKELNALRDHCPMLATEFLAEQSAQGQRDTFAKVRQGANALYALWKAGNPTLGDLLTSARQSGLLALEEAWLQALGSEGDTNETAENNTDANEQEARHPARRVPLLSQSWSQCLAWIDYANGKAVQDTQQGVKGLEFPRVMVIADDEAAGGTLFSFNRILGAEAPNATDTKNKRDGEENSIDRTIRLLYVACSRAKESVALVVWSKDPQKVKEEMIRRKWFSENEIEMIEVSDSNSRP